MADIVIASKLKMYRNRYSIPDDVPDGIVFERFVNHSVISMHHPDSVDLDADLLDMICVGGENDMGIDGLAIKFNGVFVKSRLDVDELISLSRKAEAEFIFIQSKYRDDIDTGEYGKFCAGIRDFLGDIHYEPSNEKIGEWLDIKNYIFGESVFEKAEWQSNPVVRVYYVWLGVWNGNKHIEGKFNTLANDVKANGVYGEICPHYIDNARIKALRNDIDNSYTVTLNTAGELPLTDVENIEKSSIFLVMGDEYAKILETPEGYIRKAVFFDNVRDVQGLTGINNEVLQTIRENPENFILLNNGITVICENFERQNKLLKIKNPQIVNGCQTSNVLFLAKRQGCDLSKVSVAMKLIDTADDDIVSAIVRGTNKQNIVYEVAFETARPFHKKLEEFFEGMGNGEKSDSERLYYERRSKQFYDKPGIKLNQIINVRIIMQSFISVFLKMPHMGHVHESLLIKQFKNNIFIDGQNLYQYYIAAKLYVKLESYYTRQWADRQSSHTFKNQILLI
ncbi:MAG: AIPR family protein, partial [Oscillospiraceae bacterium]|nr:AIPR family protein [Oscillospiraceae bacterium]